MLCAAALGATSLAVSAQYQWRDKSGRMNISDLPPPADIPDKDIIKRPSPPSSRRAVPAAAPAAASAASAPRGVDPEIEARRSRAEQDKAARAKADDERAATIRAENCQRARQQLSLLDSGQRIARIDSKGERVILDDEARAAEAATARQVVATDCR